MSLRYQLVDNFVEQAQLAQAYASGTAGIMIMNEPPWGLYINGRRVEIVHDDEMPCLSLDADRIDEGWRQGFGVTPGWREQVQMFLPTGMEAARGLVTSNRISSRSQNSYWIWAPSRELYAPTTIALVVKGRQRAILTRAVPRDELIQLRRDHWLSWSWTGPKSKGGDLLVRDLVGGEFRPDLSTRAEVVAAAEADAVAVLESIAEQKGLHAWML